MVRVCPPDVRRMLLFGRLILCPRRPSLRGFVSSSRRRPAGRRSCGSGFRSLVATEVAGHLHRSDRWPNCGAFPSGAGSASGCREVARSGSAKFAPLWRNSPADDVPDSKICGGTGSIARLLRWNRSKGGPLVIRSYGSPCRCSCRNRCCASAGRWWAWSASSHRPDGSADCGSDPSCWHVCWIRRA